MVAGVGAVVEEAGADSNIGLTVGLFGMAGKALLKRNNECEELEKPK